MNKPYDLFQRSYLGEEGTSKFAKGSWLFIKTLEKNTHPMAQSHRMHTM